MPNTAFIDEFLPEEQMELSPPERLTVSEWADKYRVLDGATSPEPGPWRTDRTPYARAWMDAFSDPEVETVVIQTATQVAKTETLLNVLGFIVDQKPGPAMVIYPTVDVGEDVSRTRIQPMIESHERLSRKKRGGRDLFTTLRMSFIGMDLFVAGSNSAASLASKPCEYVLFDEVNKFPFTIGEEADPISLGIERAKNFPYSRKVLMVSTPTTQHGRITTELQDCDAVFQYHVPCPLCGEYQALKFSQVKWLDVDKDDPDRLRIVEEGAYYECEACRAKLTDYDKPPMLLAGEWRPEKPYSRQKKIGFMLSSLHSPWVKFGQMAVEFLKSKPFPEKLQNFVNSWLGEPWVESSTKRDSDFIVSRADDRPRGVVPAEAVALIGTADVQKARLYYVIRAFARDYTSWLVREGVVEDFEALAEVFFVSRYPVVGSGTDRIVNLSLVDSGYRTDEVYEFARKHQGRCRAIKGATHRMTSPFMPSRVDYNTAGKLIQSGLTLWLIDTEYFKDALSRRMQMNPEDPGAWKVHSEVSRDYSNQMASEHKAIIRNRKTGRTTEEWQKVTAQAANHFWDCEVYALAGADMIGVRSFRRVGEHAQRNGRRVISRGIGE